MNAQNIKSTYMYTCIQCTCLISNKNKLNWASLALVQQAIWKLTEHLVKWRITWFSSAGGVGVKQVSWQLQLHFRYSPDEDTYVIQLLFPRNLKLEFAVVLRVKGGHFLQDMKVSTSTMLSNYQVSVCVCLCNLNPISQCPFDCSCNKVRPVKVRGERCTRWKSRIQSRRMKLRSMLWEKGRTPGDLREKQLEDRETEMEYSLSWIEEERETEKRGRC